MTAFTYTGRAFVDWLLARGYDPNRLTRAELWGLSMLFDMDRAASETLSDRDPGDETDVA